MSLFRTGATVLLVLTRAVGIAQPQTPSFHFVLAEDHEVLRPLKRAVSVVQHYRVREPYVGMSGSWLKPEETLIVSGGPVFRDSTERWQWFWPLEGVAESFLLLASGTDTMRIDLPEDPASLIQRAWARGDRETPEVIRFRKGRYTVEELVTLPWAVKAAHQLAQRLIAEDEAAYRKELAELENYYRDRPPAAPPAPPITPTPTMTEQDWAAFWAQQPPLKEVRVDRVHADTVWVRITGRVMLNGGCGSGMPLFGIEMLTDTGWVERIPFELVQLDCGMPWADWEDHEVMIPPLRWWVGANQPADRRELRPSRYRLLLIGGDNKPYRTTPFLLE